ncbi:hypothetical protein B0T20DRAFT_182619 [Sordaria brevicollis]|uniref:Uncharacterized protein n=1 Tax=Sordaria brevicollis TaxID=83679 RepID=A0AAE0PI13_SORBR|nr:hypothetical protein B0T20DRAFT_182619 [Sordaria brevicollis]
MAHRLKTSSTRSGHSKLKPLETPPSRKSSLSTARQIRTGLGTRQNLGPARKACHGQPSLSTLLSSLLQLRRVRGLLCLTTCKTSKDDMRRACLSCSKPKRQLFSFLTRSTVERTLARRRGGPRVDDDNHPRNSQRLGRLLLRYVGVLWSPPWRNSPQLRAPRPPPRLTTAPLPVPHGESRKPAGDPGLQWSLGGVRGGCVTILFPLSPELNHAFFFLPITNSTEPANLPRPPHQTPEKKPGRLEQLGWTTDEAGPNEQRNSVNIK